MFNFEIDDKNLYILPKENELKFINSKKTKTMLYHKKIINLNNYEKNLYRYTFKDQINKGGSSIIYTAIDNITKTKVIIKELQSDNNSKFFREINILDLCRTLPNIIKLIDFFEKNGKFYLVFPFIDTPSTRNILYKFNSTDLILFMKKCLETLQNIHKIGIIHRDIKPSNILVKSATEINIIDFGISDFYLPFRKFSNKIGTKNFRSPEQIIKIKGFDYKIDIWAIGIIFAEAIFKKFPFIKPEEDDIIIKKIAEIAGKTKFLNFLEKYNINENFEFINSLDEMSLIDKLFETSKIDEKFNLIELKKLLDGLLEIDPEKRLTAKEALELEIFNNSDI